MLASYLPTGAHPQPDRRRHYLVPFTLLAMLILGAVGFFHHAITQSQLDMSDEQTPSGVSENDAFGVTVNGTPPVFEALKSTAPSSATGNVISETKLLVSPTKRSVVVLSVLVCMVVVAARSAFALWPEYGEGEEITYANFFGREVEMKKFTKCVFAACSAVLGTVLFAVLMWSVFGGDGRLMISESKRDIIQLSIALTVVILFALLGIYLWPVLLPPRWHGEVSLAQSLFMAVISLVGTVLFVNLMSALSRRAVPT